MISAPGAVVVLILHIRIPDGILNVVQAVAGVFQGPLVVDAAQRHTGILGIHADILAAIGERPGAVVVVGHSPDVGLAKAGEDTVGERDSSAAVIEAAVNAGKGLIIGGSIDYHLVAVGDGTGGSAVQVDFGGGGVAQLEGGVIHAHSGGDGDDTADSNRPGAVIVLFNGGLVKLDRVGAVGNGNVRIGILAAVIVDLCDFHILKSHIGADVGGGQFSDGLDCGLQLQTGGLFIGSAVQFGQALEVGPLAGSDDRITQGDIIKFAAHTGTDTAGAVLKIDVLPVQQGNHTLDGQIFRIIGSSQRLGDGDGLRLCGAGVRAAFAVQFIKGEVTGITCVDGGVFISAEFVLALLIAGQRNGIVTNAVELEGSVGKGNGPGIVSGFNTVFVAALGSDLCTVVVGEGHALRRNSQVPHQIGGGVGERSGLIGQFCGGEPGALQRAHGVSAVDHHDILAVGQLFLGGNLLECAGGFRRESCGREQG